MLHRVLAWYKIKGCKKEKQRRAARIPNVVFVVASHYQSLQIVILLLQGSLRALSRILLLQQLHRVQQAVSTLCSSAVVEDRECCMLLEGKVEMSSQLRSRQKGGLAAFLYSNCCSLESSLHCSYWPFIEVMKANRVSALSIQMAVELVFVGERFNCIFLINA